MWALPGALWRRLRGKQPKVGRTITSNVYAAEIKAHARKPTVFRTDYSDKLDELRRQVSCYSQEIQQLREDLQRARERNLALEAKDIYERTSINIIETTEED